MDTIGNRLKYLRESKTLSQAELGVILGKAQKTISNYEKQERELGYDMLKKYAHYFGVTIDWIINGVETPTKKIEAPIEEATIAVDADIDFSKFSPEQIEVLRSLAKQFVKNDDLN